MELVKKHVHMNKCNCRKTIQITLDNDFNVPDAKADAYALIRDQGEVIVEEVRFHAGKGIVKGTLQFSLLYAGDEEGRPVVDFKGTIPFEESIGLDEACSEDELTVRCILDDLRSELINSRKFGVKAILSIEIMAESVFDGEGATELSDAEGVYTKNRELTITKLAMCKKDTFRFRDEWNLPGSKESVENVLYSNVMIQELDSRLTENKINLNGQAKVFIIYMSAGEERALECAEAVFPISGSVECNGCDESMVPHIQIGLHSSDVEVKEDSDGERRVVDLEAVLDLYIKVYREEEMSVLTDFYSMNRKLTPIYQDSYFEKLLMKNNSRLRVSGKVQIPENTKVKQIWNVDGALRIDSRKAVKEGVRIEGVVDVNVMYLSDNEEMPLSSSKGILPFEQIVNIPDMKLDANPEEYRFFSNETMDQISGNVVGDNEMEVKVGIALDVIAFETIVTPMITDFTDEEMEKEVLESQPGFVGYVVKDGDDLWNIARSFYTTVETIMDLNEKDTEEVEEGEILLLMKQPLCAF